MPDPHVERYLRFVPTRLRAPLVPTETEWFPRGGGTTLHLHRHPAPAATPRARIVVLHGAGGHGRMLSAVGVLAQELGCSAVAPDLPGYGHTVVSDPSTTTYLDWVRAGLEVVDAEASHGQPVVVFGASMGGRLALDIAHLAGGAVDAVVATCLLDPRRPEVRRVVARHPALGRLAPLLGTAPGLTDRVRVPIGWVAPIRAIANDPALAATCAADPLGAGGRIPLGFVRSWFTHDPGYEPETFAACPVTLAHPGDDRWTPIEISRAWFDGLTVDKQVHVLDGCGHFPVEEPGVTQLGEALAATVPA